MSDNKAAGPGATGGPGEASAGVPAGNAPSGATTPGETPQDAEQEVVPASPDTIAGEGAAQAVPGYEAGVPPVPSPGTPPGTAVPAVQAAQGQVTEQAEDADGDNRPIASPGARPGLAVPGKPDGEVDTRAR